MNQETIDRFTIDTSEILTRLKSHSDVQTNNRVNILEKKLNSLFSGLDTLRNNNSLLTIGIVGQMNVGKSSFLNALLFEGEPVLPKAATPMTAGLTTIERSKESGKNYIEVEYYTHNEWDSIRATASEVDRRRSEILKEEPILINNENLLHHKLKAEVGEVAYASYEIVKKITPLAQSRVGHPAERFTLMTKEDISKSLNQYVGAKGIYTSVVKALHIYLDNESLDGLRIVDTPGVNDPVVTREAKTSEFLREAHGVIMMMSASAFLTGSDIDFLNNRIGKAGISSIVMVVNKIDTVCCSGKYRNGYRLKDSFADICESLKKHYEEKRFLFISPDNIKGIVFTSGIADSIAQKLSKDSEKIDEDEMLALCNLKKIYPEDFTERILIDSLEILTSQNQILYEDYIEGEFIRKKDEIMNSKLSAFISEHRKDIIQTLQDIIDEVKNEVVFLKEESIDSLEKQTDLIKTMIEQLLPGIQTEIAGSILKINEEIKTAFEAKLYKVKPSVSELPTDVKGKDYTRKGTLAGFNKSGKVSISILNTAELCRNEEQQVDKFRAAVSQYWNEFFVNERTRLINYILDEITEMAKNGASLNVDDTPIRNLVNTLVKTKLIGMETLELIDKCEEFKETFRKSISVPSFIDIQSVFGEIDQSTAEEKIKNQAESNLYAALLQTKALNQSLYKSLRDIYYEQYRVVKDILEQFKSEFVELMNQEIKKQKEQLKMKMRSKEESLKSTEEILSDFETIKINFNNL